jgi:hypothetical protein
LKIRHHERQRALKYLYEDLCQHLGRLADLVIDDPYATDLLANCQKRLDYMSGLDIGTELQLNELQYTLGEMQIGLCEMDSDHKLISKMIQEIQDHLDWAS